MINQAMIKLKTSVFKKYSEWRGKPQSRKRYLQSYPEYLKNHYQNNKQTNKNPWIVYEKMGQRLEKTHTHTHPKMHKYTQFNYQENKKLQWNAPTHPSK